MATDKDDAKFTTREENMTQKHTALPWEKIEMPNGYYAIRRVGHDINVAMVTDTNQDQVAVSGEDADLIVNAVNRYERLISALRGLLKNPSIDLGDKIYDIRESEGKGWDGPDVKAWEEAVGKANELLSECEGDA